MKPRLYLRLYLAFLGITVLSLVVTALLARAFHEPGVPAASSLLPIADSLDCGSPGPCRKLLSEASRQLSMDIVIWDRQRQVLFEAGRGFPPAPRRLTAGWHHTARGPVWLTPLSDGRVMGLRERGHMGPRGRLFLPMLVAVLVAMAIGLLPLSRSITRRLEHLAEGARRWGAGDLAHRVPVEGKDEIASLGERFNQAATAIEALLAQERQMLATASHELRSPLARIRVGLELLSDESDADKRGDLIRRSCEDIAELDSLVEELLVAARAQPGVPRRPFAGVDMLPLVRGEAAEIGAEVRGESAVLDGEEAMLKRMVRNLLTNARLHGRGDSIRADVHREGNDVVIGVEDDGPGVPDAERERIFAPFYRPPGPRPPGDTGLGLGLALVRQIARYHHGDVAFVPLQPSGSRFEVRLPARSTG